MLWAVVAKSDGMARYRPVPHADRHNLVRICGRQAQKLLAKSSLTWRMGWNFAVWRKLKKRTTRLHCVFEKTPRRPHRQSLLRRWRILSHSLATHRRLPRCPGWKVLSKFPRETRLACGVVRWECPEFAKLNFLRYHFLLSGCHQTIELYVRMGWTTAIYIQTAILGQRPHFCTKDQSVLHVD